MLTKEENQIIENLLQINFFRYDKNKLPLGLQLIGRPFDEQIILNLSLALQKRMNFKRNIESWWK